MNSHLWQTQRIKRDSLAEAADDCTQPVGSYSPLHGTQENSRHSMLHFPFLLKSSELQEIPAGNICALPCHWSFVINAPMESLKTGIFASPTSTLKQRH